NKIEGRITNGYPAYEGKAPYTVGLGFSGGWWCGGSIISNTWVLTAEHCTGSAEAVTVYFGATWRTNAQYTHYVSRNDMINHGSKDISLIRIPHVDFWSMVNKVELPSYNDRYNDYNNWWAVACGWGGTYDGSPLPDWLQCVDLQVISNSECAQTYGTGTVTDSIICVRTPDGKSTCGGDSGGPLVSHDGNKLIGVTNWVSAAGCQSGHPSGFQRVTYHLDWIPVTVYFGATWRTNAQYTHYVSRNDMINHGSKDISLIRIPHVDFWSMVNKVELPSYNDRYNDYNNWWAVACGWGGTYDGSPLPDWLQCVDLQVISNSECAQTYGTGTVTDSIICVRTPDGKSTCGGDSGGPLVSHDGNKLIGVTNWVSAAGCQSGHPSGFQRVTYHLDWIREHTGI
ncbi:hypothetical protein KR215_003135, partial [Drosophila sulfurigaster]